MLRKRSAPRAPGQSPKGHPARSHHSSHHRTNVITGLLSIGNAVDEFNRATANNTCRARQLDATLTGTSTLCVVPASRCPNVNTTSAPCKVTVVLAAPANCTSRGNSNRTRAR